MIESWPEGLRNAGASGSTGGPQSNVNAFTPETGPPIYRRNSTTVVKTYSIELPLLSKDERDIFLTFFHDILQDGMAPFLWVDPMRGMTDFIENGIESYYQKMRFVLVKGQMAYTETRVTSDKWTIKFNVVLLK